MPVNPMVSLCSISAVVAQTHFHAYTIIDDKRVSATRVHARCRLYGCLQFPTKD